MSRIAICYWGQTRTLDMTYESHVKHIYDILDKNNIHYDKYIHTWLSSTSINYDRYTFKEITIEDQAPLIKEIDETLSDYWHEEKFNIHGGRTLHEWYPQMLKNGIYSMTSMKRVTEMCLNSGISYDYIFYIRPDCRFSSDITLDFIGMSDESIVCAREHWGSHEVFGINDVWGIIPINKAKNYGFRVDEAKYYRKNIGRVAGENYVGWIVQKYFTNIIYSDIKFDLCRG
jgi:hypothetical protein